MHSVTIWKRQLIFIELSRKLQANEVANNARYIYRSDELLVSHNEHSRRIGLASLCDVPLLTSDFN